MIAFRKTKGSRERYKKRNQVERKKQEKEPVRKEAKVVSHLKIKNFNIKRVA